LAAKPCDSIPQAFNNWSGAKAAYRFIENERVTCEGIKDLSVNNRHLRKMAGIGEF